MGRKGKSETTKLELPQMVKRKKAAKDQEKWIESLLGEVTKRPGSSPQTAQKVNDAIVDKILNQNHNLESHSQSTSVSILHDTYDTSKDTQPRQPIAFDELSDEDEKEDVEMIVDLSNRQDNTTVSLSISPVSVEPISARVMVNVSHPTTVWCEGVVYGRPFTPSSIRDSREATLIYGSLRFGVSFLDSGIITVNNLFPDTLYDVYCYGTSAFGDVGPSPLNTMKPIHTEKTTFEIDNIVIKDKSISFSLISNIPVAGTCVLFDSQCNFDVIYVICS